MGDEDAHMRSLQHECVDDVVICEVPECVGLKSLVVLVDTAAVDKSDSR